MTWSEQHRHARHWIFRELDRLIEQRSRSKRKEPSHIDQRELPRLVRLRRFSSSSFVRPDRRAHDKVDLTARLGRDEVCPARRSHVAKNYRLLRICRILRGVTGETKGTARENTRSEWYREGDQG